MSVHGSRPRSLHEFNFAFVLFFTSSLFVFSCLLFQQGVHGTIQGWRRVIRQVNVTSGGQAMGNGNQTDMSAANAMWKNVDGTIGANGTSLGNAAGPGNSNLMSNSYSVVGNRGAEGTGSSFANGTLTKSSGMTSSNVIGNQSNVQTLASGAALGTGNSEVAASGAGTLMNGNQTSPNSGRNTYGKAGATGSMLSASSVMVGQTLSWSNIWANLYAMSTSKGENNSQANIALRGGATGNSIGVDGLVSGVNDKGGGSSFSQAIGSGSLNNGTASMGSSLIGAVNASVGGSKLVGASSLTGNTTNNKNTLNSFGDLRLNGTGQSMGGLISNNSIGPDGTVRGVVGAQGMGNGANKSIAVNDGLQSTDGKGNSQGVIGQGKVEGMGNMAANGSSFVLSNYQTGQGPNLVVGSAGESKAQNGTASDLRISNQGNFLNGSAITNASSNAFGKVTGEQSSVSGRAGMNLGQTQSGTSSIVATGGGKGPSSALTDTGLNLAGPGGTAPRSETVKGSVDASGDQTYVQSISQVSDQNGLQSLFNSQNATVQGKGSSQAKATNYAILKRRRRRRSLRVRIQKLNEILRK